MSHRYPTRFQLKTVQAVQAVQPQQAVQSAAIQAASKAVASKADVEQDELKRQQEADAAVVNYFLARAAASKSFLDKVLETIKLFEHLYECPVLLTTHLRIKYIVWHKMAQLDSELTNVLMGLPSTLDIDLDVLATRTNIARLHNLMNMIRQKYY
jgi:hypothetical protein